MNGWQNCFPVVKKKMCDSPLYGIFWKVTYYGKDLNWLAYEKYDLVNWKQDNKPQNEKLSKLFCAMCLPLDQNKIVKLGTFIVSKRNFS